MFLLTHYLPIIILFSCMYVIDQSLHFKEALAIYLIKVNKML